MKHTYTKMQSSGNKFVFLDSFRQPLQLSSERIRQIADPRQGPGCDQILVLGKPTEQSGSDGGTDVTCQIYNADGSSAQQCGNGMCCAAIYLHDKDLISSDTVRVHLGKQHVLLQIIGNNQVSAELGVPEFAPENIPANFPRQQPRYNLKVAGERHEVSVVSLGNPHVVLGVDDVARAPVAKLGAAIQGLDVFPEGVNVGFVQNQGLDAIRLRVFERGAGETLSCGSGACAAVVVGHNMGQLTEHVAVTMPGGILEVNWPGAAHPVRLEAKVSTLSEGTLQL